MTAELCTVKAIVPGTYRSSDHSMGALAGSVLRRRSRSSGSPGWQPGVVRVGPYEVDGVVRVGDHDALFLEPYRVRDGVRVQRGDEGADGLRVDRALDHDRPAGERTDRSMR